MSCALFRVYWWYLSVLLGIFIVFTKIMIFLTMRMLGWLAKFAFFNNALISGIMVLFSEYASMRVQFKGANKTRAGTINIATLPCSYGCVWGVDSVKSIHTFLEKGTSNWGACASFGGYHYFFLRGGDLFQLEEGVHFSRRGHTSTGGGGAFQ